jgi:acyl carrier protein
MDSAETRQRLLAVFRQVFADDRIEIHEGTTAHDIPQWDSLSNINLILAVEKAFNIRLTIREVRVMKNVGDLMALIGRKVV